MYATSLLGLSALALAGHAFLLPEYLAKKRLAEVVYDPESLRLSELSMDRSRDAVCGRLNAKNRFGAYVGARRFIALNTGVEIEEEPPSAYESGKESGEDKLRKIETFRGLHAIYCR